MDAGQHRVDLARTVPKVNLRHCLVVRHEFRQARLFITKTGVIEACSLPSGSIAMMKLELRQQLPKYLRVQLTGTSAFPLEIELCTGVPWPCMT